MKGFTNYLKNLSKNIPINKNMKEVFFLNLRLLKGLKLLKKGYLKKD